MLSELIMDTRRAIPLYSFLIQRSVDDKSYNYLNIIEEN